MVTFGIAARVLDGDGGGAARGDAGDRGGESREIGVPRGRHVGEDGPTIPARRAQDASMGAGGHVAARPRVGFLDVAGREDLLVLHEHHARAVATRRFGPHTREVMY
jgi:hypothetical protein